MNRMFPASDTGQRGLSLLLALILLLTMSIAGIALVASVDTTTLLAGNIAFRQGASLAGDVGVEKARGYLLAHAANLTENQPAAGYYATRQDALDLTGNATPGAPKDDVRWPGVADGIATPYCEPNTDSAGNKVCYIIHRMCNLEGPVAIDTCSTQLTGTGPSNGTGVPPGSSRGAVAASESYKGQAGGGSGGAAGSSVLLTYYRVTVRIESPRSNFSFIQAFLLI